MKDESKIFRGRMGLLLGGVSLWCLLILGQLIKLQVIQGNDIKQKAEEMHTAFKAIPALRGQIVDKNGRLLALSIWEPSICADPSKIDDPKATVNALAKALGEGESWRKSMLSYLSNKKRKFRYVKKRASHAEAAAVQPLGLKGIYVTQEPWRKYPNNWLGSHLLGFINQDRSAMEGLERSYDQRMEGKKGKIEVLRDGKGRRNGLSQKVLKEPEDGSDVHLTIDLNIQLFAEDALRRGMRQTRAESITAIVMEPDTGAILAMANAPDFNPNVFNKSSGNARRNRAVVDVYEPGSAFKVVTVAAAIDTNSVSMDQVFYSSPGPIKAYDKRIRNHPPFGPLNVSEILWHSSNSGTVQIATSMDTRDFFDYIQRFGFGSRTNVDLPAESPGILRNHADWDNASPYFLSMGHEISVTPLQMLSALCAVANGGYRVQPFLANRVVDASGESIDLRPETAPVRVIKPETAKALVQALRGVVTEGTAKRAAIEGTSVFGKTGTAQRIQGSTYAKNKFNSSFVGFFPAEAPRYGMIVVVHDPKGSKVHGGDVAAPIFGEIGKRIMDYERASKPNRKLTVSAQAPAWSEMDALPDSDGSTMPDFTGFGLRHLHLQARRLGIKLDIKGTGRVLRQWPNPGAPIPENRSCSVILNEG